MHQSDFIQIVTIGLFRKFMIARDDTLLQKAEHALELSFGQSEQFEPLRFIVDTNSQQQLNFMQWVDWAKASGAIAIELRQQSDFAIERKPTKLEGKEINQRYLAAFAGTHENVIALKYIKHALGFRYQIEFPARTLITLEDLLAFIDAHPQERVHFHESMLWQNEHNLHFGEAKSIDQLIAMLTPDRISKMVDSFAMSVSNINVSAQTRDEWWELCKQKRNPAAPKHWLFSFGQAQLPAVSYAAVAKQCVRLRAALKDILDYSRNQKLEQFSAAFAHALKCLDPSLVVDPNSRSRILADLYPDQQYRLFAAISACGVFGGMGSWNDLGLDDDSEYARVSDQLFRTRNELIESGCNCDNLRRTGFSLARFFRSRV